MPDSRKKLYDAISSEFDLGTFEEFNSKMDIPESRKKLYESVSVDFDLGTFDEFESKVGVLKKKEQPQPFGGQIFTQGIGLGVKPISSTTSPSVSKQPKSIIPSESIDGKDFEERKKNILSKSDVNIETLPIYEQSQKQLRDADIQINSFNMIGNVDKIPDPKIREQAQIERDALLENRKGLAAKANASQVLIQPEIDKLIKNSVSNKGLDYFFKENLDGTKVPDEEKIDFYSKTIASSAGLPVDGYAKSLIYNNFKSSLQYQKDKPFIEKKFNELYQSKYGASAQEEFKKSAIKGLTAKKEIEGNLQNQNKYLVSEAKIGAKSELEKISSDFTPKIEELNESYKSNQSLLNQQMQANADQYKNGLISFEEAKQNENDLKAKFQQSEEEYKVNFQAFSDEYLNVQKEVIGRYDKKYKRQLQEAVQIAEQRLREETAKYGKVSSEIEKRYNETWKEASGSYYKAEESIKKLKDDIKGGGVVFAESLVSGLGDALKTISSFAGIDEGVVMGDYLNSLFTLSSPKIDSAKDLLDMTKLIRSSGQMIGGMTPMLATQALVATLTQGASIPTQLLLQGGIGFTLETMQNAGGAYEDKFAETGNVAAAEKAAQMQIEGNSYLLPLYALDGLPFISEATLGIKNILLRGLAKGGVETLTELPQEYFQGIFEDLARDNKGLSDISEKMTLERLEDTALNIIPSTFAMGAIPTYAGGVSKYVKDVNTKAFAAKQDLHRMSTTALQQYLYGITLQRGESFAKAYLSGLQQNGSLKNVDLEQVASVINTAQQVVRDAAKFNLSKGKSKVYSYFMLNKQIAQTDLENAETLSVQKAAEARLKMYEEAAVNFLTNGKGDFAVIKLANNEQYVASFQEIKNMLEDPRFSAKLAKGEIEITLEKDKQASEFAALTEQIKQTKDAIKTKDEVSSGGTSARTDNTGTEVGDIASVTDKGESGKEVVAETEVVPALKNVESTAKAFDKLETSKSKEFSDLEDMFIDAGLTSGEYDNNTLSEAYHKAKKDGSNPELVKAVESLLSKEQAPTKEVKYNIDEARQQFIKDNEIEAFQEKFGYQPYNPFESLPDGVYETILRVEDNIPTSLTAIEEASNWLYSQYKMLEAKKVSDKRDMTIPQIDEVLSELEGAITELENFKNKLYEESGQAKTGQDTTSVQAVDGQTSQGVRVGEEIATPTQEVAKEEISEQAKINKQNERADDRKPAAGNRLFNEPIKEIGAIADKYFKRVFGKERPKFKGTRKFDKAFSRKIAEAYAKMENNPNSPDVKAAYNALAKETLAQYKALLAAGYEIEISEENFYKNSQEMIDDVVKNKRIKIFSTEAGFGNKPISKKSRKENPMLMESGMKDKNGVPLLNNDLFRAVHDIIGHGELGNSFGAIGEENAFQIHARLYSPLARKALATETRGQNSFVNFSGINDKVSLMVEEARKLRAEGKEAEAQNLVEKIYEDLSFAEQKMGILPEEFYSIDESFEGEMEEPALSESAQGKENETQQIADELLSLLGLPTEETDVKFSKKTGEPQVLTSTEDKEQQIIDQMNKMNLVNEGIDLVAPSTTEEEIDVDELNSRLENPLKTVEWADYEGIPFTFTISDQLRTGDAANPNTGQTITDLKGGIGFNGTKGNENNAWANTTKEEADAMLQRAKDVYANNKPLFDKLWKEGKLPDGHIPMAVVKMAETSILSNEAVFRVGIQNIETLPKANRKKAVLELAKSMQAKINTESASLKRGVDKNGKPYTENTIKLKKKTINQYQKILDYINKNKYEDIVDILKDKDNFSLPEKSLIANEVFYGSPTPIGGKEIDISRSRPSTPVSKALIGNKNPSLINLSKITDLLTEPSMKNVPNMHVVSIVGVDVKANEANKINHPNYPYGVKGVSLGVLKNPVHMKDVFGEAYGSALGQVVKNEANNASVSVKNVLTQGIPVQSGLTNRVFKSAIAKGELDAVDKLAGFLRQAFPSTTFFTSEEAWEAAMKDPSVKKKLKDGDVVYAFTTDGNVFINPSLKTTKATLHETGHIWVGFVKENNPALHAKGLELVTGTKEHQKAIKEYGDTELAREEALMELMSSKGDTIVNAAQKAKFKEWLLSVYKYIADNFTSLLGLSPKQIENLTLDKFLEGMLADVLSGKELTTKKIKGEVRFSREAQDNKIEDFVESQRKAGKSDSNIRTALELVADKLGLTPSDIDSLMSAEKKPAKKREFTKNILDIAKETGLSPQEVEDTYKKYDGSKDIQEVTVEDYNSARAAGDKVKLDNSKKAFEAFLSEDSNSPTAKKNAAKLKEELGKDTLKGAKKIMDNIDEIREKLLNAKVIKPVNCKWGK
jgi:hypothetical protein